MEKTETKENENPLNINALQISTPYGLWKTSGKDMKRRDISRGLKLAHLPSKNHNIVARYLDANPVSKN